MESNSSGPAGTRQLLIDPDAFPPQPPTADRRVADYIAEATAASRETMRQWPPQRHAYGPHRSQVLDIFAGESIAASRPALIFFHGGAWIAGYPWWSSYMAPGVREAGGILVTPTYRLAPAAKFPAQLEDVAAAIAWVFRNAAQFGIDPDRLVIGGHSAGGHLAALTCLHPSALPQAGVPQETVKACMPVSSSFNLHSPDAAPGNGEERVYKFLLADRDDDRVASPINYLSGHIPPFHIVYGNDDLARIVRSSREMAAAVRSRHGPISVEEWRGHDHFDTHLALRDPQHPWYARLQEMFAATAPQQAAC